MPLNDYQIPPVANWSTFEELCRDLWAYEWSDINTQKNGREGQPQHGVDVFGIYQGKQHTVQCKGKNNTFNSNIVTKKELLEEVEKAKKFTPPINDFILATTAPNDANIQEYARELSLSSTFRISVVGWDYILGLLNKYPDLIKKYYPQFNFQKNPEENPSIFDHWYKNYINIKNNQNSFWYNTSYLPNAFYNVGYNPSFLEMLLGFSDSFLTLKNNYNNTDSKLSSLFEVFIKIVEDLVIFLNNTVDFNKIYIAQKSYAEFWVKIDHLQYQYGNGNYIDYKKHIFRCLMLYLVKITNTIIVYCNNNYNSNFTLCFWAEDDEQIRKSTPSFDINNIYYVNLNTCKTNL
jgi:hypothetical protein